MRELIISERAPVTLMSLKPAPKIVSPFVGRPYPVPTVVATGTPSPVQSENGRTRDLHRNLPEPKDETRIGVCERQPPSQTKFGPQYAHVTGTHESVGRV
jgi:hypothetical protein